LSRSVADDRQNRRVALQSDATMQEAAKPIVDGLPKRVTERK
jgi:hypothetical protein